MTHTTDVYKNIQTTLRILRGHRAWHADLQGRFKLHPVVDKLAQAYRPADWQRLVLEYPHQAESDRSRIAYTQTERKGHDDIQTVTTLGKYIKRHFPQVEDHTIRDAVAAYAVTGCKIVRTTAEMLYHLARGPSSCMKKDNFKPDAHPYLAYCPSLGWGLAVREEGDDTVARALVNDTDKTYVRSYYKAGSYSHSDTELEAWLQEQGYEKAADWEELHLKWVDNPRQRGSFLAPYLDGGMKTVDESERDGQRTLCVCEDGAWKCDRQDGEASDTSGSDCSDCGNRVHDGDGYWTGPYDEVLVCERCCDRNYTYAYSRRGDQRYINNNRVINVDDEYYDADYLEDNNIVQLANGKYACSDDAVYVSSTGEYYDADDEDICYTVDGEYELREDCVLLENGEWCLESDAWMCEHSDEWYQHSEVERVTTKCGKTIHPDHAEEYELVDAE
jgi:hypothetical protein